MVPVSQRPHSGGMPLKDRLYMAPIDKYEHYGRFPWKVVIQLLLVFFTTCQTILLVHSITTYSLNQYVQWYKIFVDPGAGDSSLSLNTPYLIFNISDFLEYFHGTLHKYYNINNYTMAQYAYEYDEGNIVPAKLYVKYLDTQKAQELGYLQEYSVTPSDLGPFQGSSPKAYLNLVSRFTLEVPLIHHLDENLDLQSTCIKWHIMQHYDYSKHGPIHVNMDAERSNCSKGTFNVLKNYIWINIFVFGLSLVSIGIVCMYLMQRAQLVASLQGSTGGFRNSWEGLTFRQKLRFFDMWVILTVVGNLCQMFGAVMFLYNQEIIQKVQETLIGLGCFCAWVGLTRFLEHTSNAYIIINTLKRSFNVIIPYIIGLLPIFMAYVFLGFCLFWKTGVYTGTTDSMVAAFAVLLGDSVYDFFIAAVRENNFIGQLYMFSFIVFFICVVHNIFIAIIQEGFGSLRERPIKKGYESDEETEPPLVLQKQKKRETLKEMQQAETLKKSKQAFKQILTGDVGLLTIEQNTRYRKQLLKSITQEIEDSLQKMKNLAAPSDSEMMDAEALHHEYLYLISCIKQTLNKLSN